MTARWVAGEPARPGAGQARSTVLTGTVPGCGTGWPAATVTVWFHTARPAAAARARTTPARGSIRCVVMPLTSPARPARRAARGPAQGARPPNAGRRPPTGSSGEPAAAAGAAVTGRRRRAGRQAAWTAEAARQRAAGPGTHRPQAAAPGP